MRAAGTSAVQCSILLRVLDIENNEALARVPLQSNPEEGGIADRRVPLWIKKYDRRF